jgi:hypothetical protein
VRHNQWKLVFAEQRAKTFRVWSEPFVTVRDAEAVQPALATRSNGRTPTQTTTTPWWVERSAFVM